jgi:hypothetical protein
VEGEACGKRKATPDLGEEPTTEGVGACAKKSCSGGGRKVIVDWEKRARGWRRHSLCRAPVPLRVVRVDYYWAAGGLRMLLDMIDGLRMLLGLVG